MSKENVTSRDQRTPSHWEILPLELSRGVGSSLSSFLAKKGTFLQSGISFCIIKIIIFPYSYLMLSTVIHALNVSDQLNITLQTLC